MKFSKNFERDFNFYSKNLIHFTFCGTLIPKFKAISNSKGKTAKQIFYQIESNGNNEPTSEPELLDKLLLCKASVNFMIKQWAEGRADGTLPLKELSKKRYEDLYPKKKDTNKYLLVWENNKPVYYDDMETYYQFPNWVIDAIENQKIKKASN
ncbi:hypothetical protein [Flavobacterium psychrophilum]|uniref:Uncharacterized protein n=1 Tax=Flavobacterium psychrophilum TaxID=96345 RepID=A0A7U2NFC8_FLAPS|nr:hypothetical protein [Flavobacterium psychrophilum]QRE03507.1 hypothetical protein H0H26_11545 [Flavobacterium psychrophilum]